MVAALNGLMAVAFGAFAAHGIADPQAKGWLATAAGLQLPHAAVVFAVLGWRDTHPVRGAAWALAAGSLIFAASLDLLALGLPRGIAALAPVGGTLMLAGWGRLAWLAARQ